MKMNDSEFECDEYYEFKAKREKRKHYQVDYITHDGEWGCKTFSKLEVARNFGERFRYYKVEGAQWSKKGGWHYWIAHRNYEHRNDELDYI